MPRSSIANFSFDLIGCCCAAFCVVVTCRAASTRANAARPELPVEGTWIGSIQGPASVGLVLNFAHNSDGWSATALVPIWGERKWPLDVVITEDGKLTAKLATSGDDQAEISCRLHDDVLSGDYRFRGETFRISLHRGGDPQAIEPRHSQVPGPSLEYHEIKISVRSGINVLTGVVYLPNGSEPHPACVDVPGSLPHKVDPGIPGDLRVRGQTFSYWVLDDFFARHGVAVLRLNSRGLGGSTGEYADATIDGLADDVSAAVKYLQSMPEIDSRRVGAIGSSRGAAVAPLAASRDRAISFLILFAAPGMQGDEVDLQQGKKLRELRNRESLARFRQKHPHSDIEWLKRFDAEDERYIDGYNRAMFDLVKAGLGPEAVLEKMMQKDRFTDDSELRAAKLARLRALATPLERSWLNYNPIPVFEKLRDVPILVLHGDADCRIQMEQNLPKIEEALRRAKNNSVTIRTFSGLGHSFLQIPVDDPLGDRDSSLSIDPAVLTVVQSWISNKVTSGAGSDTGETKSVSHR